MVLEKDLLVVKNIVSDDIIEDYCRIIKLDDESYADYIASAILYSIKKTKNLYPKDKFKVIVNKTIYMLYCLFDFEHKNYELEDVFESVKNFIDEFVKYIKHLETFLYNEELTPEMAADVYLIYFTTAKIYENVFYTFDAELKTDFLRSRGIQANGLYDKSLEETLKEFKQISNLSRKLKKEE